MNNCNKLIKAIDNYITKAEDNLKDLLSKEGYVNPEDTMECINNLEEAITEALKNETIHFTKGIDGAIDLETFADEIWPGIKLTDELAEEISTIIKNQFTEFMPKLIETYLQQAETDLILTQVSKRTVDWVNEWGEELGEKMKLTSHKQIEAILTKGLEQGTGIQSFVRDILDSGIREERYRARRVAVTEVLRAHSVAGEEGIQQSPATDRKEWVHTGSYRNKPRDNHIKISGKPVDKDKPFILDCKDGEKREAEYPRAINLPVEECVNCHCIHRGIVNDEIIGMPLEERRRLQAEAIAKLDDKYYKELNEKNKAKAGINEDTITYDWLKAKSKEDQIKYFGGVKSKWALLESGVIKDDKDLEKMFKTTEATAKDGTISKKRSLKNLKELHNDGIITISGKTLNHSTIGEFVKPTPLGVYRHKSGAHGQEGLNECINKEVAIEINGEFNNGVRFGNILDSRQKFKQSGNSQLWFPKKWSEDDILLAGTYIANNKNDLIDGYHKTAEYQGVAVRVLFDNANEVTTICPDINQELYIKE